MLGRGSGIRREGQKENNRDAGNRRVFETSGSRQGDIKWGGVGVASGSKGREGKSF